jgi:ketosteroid isomerase-like protein
MFLKLPEPPNPSRALQSPTKQIVILRHRGGKQMKIPLVVALVSAGMCISLPTLAQDQKAIDAAVRKQIEAVLTEFRVAYNRHDAAAVAALYTPDAVEFRSWRGLLSGQEAIRSSFQLDFASSDGEMVSQLTQLRPVGNAICQIAHSNVGEWKDETVVIYVRDGDTWKRRMVYVNGNPQEKNALDPEVRREIEAKVMQFDDAYNKDNPDDIAVLHTQDAVEVRSWEGAKYLRTGRRAIAIQYANDFRSHPKLATKISELYPIGNDVCAIMDWNVGTLKGYALKIFTRDSDNWKIGMSYLNGSPGT